MCIQNRVWNIFKKSRCGICSKKITCSERIEALEYVRFIDTMTKTLDTDIKALGERRYGHFMKQSVGKNMLMKVKNRSTRSIDPFIMIVSFGLVLLIAFSAGCTWSDPTYEYKKVLFRYNDICALGSTAKQDQSALDKFEEMEGNPHSWTKSEDRTHKKLKYNLDESIYQYNGYVGKYNKEVEDKTRNWLKSALLPSHIPDYTPETVLTNDDVIYDEVSTRILDRD